MTQIFDRSFQPALEGLAPDGSAIDVPLGVFSDLPGDVLDQLVRGMSLRTAEPGEVLVREGEIGDACFVIASGEVRVLKREPTEPHGEPIEVARLGHGAVFGEFALLADRRRHATVEVIQQAELFEIPRRLASELAASYAEVRPALERFYRERLLSTLLTTTPPFQPLPAERRADVLAHFHPRRSESGEAIVREGSHAGGLFLIVLGQVEITKRVAQRRSVLLATLGEGAYFGEMSLLHGEPASASVTATGPTELAVLPAEAFYELVAEYPVLWESMKREAGRRDLETHRLVTGNTSVV
jgi:cAMP-dependent protein kinase regulator